MAEGINSNSSGRISTASGLKEGDPTAAGCCCGPTPTPCPTDCSACPGRAVALSGLAGSCACANGTYALTRSGCVWSYAGATADGDPFSRITFDLRCVGGSWTLTITCLSTCAATGYQGDFSGAGSLPHRPGTDDCGRLGTYTVPDGGFAVHCPGQTATAVVS